MTVDHLEGLLHVQTNKVTTSLVCFVDQLVEECTSIAEVMGLTPVQACMFFRLYFLYWLSGVRYSEDHSHIQITVSQTHICYRYNLKLLAMISISLVCCVLHQRYQKIFSWIYIRKKKTFELLKLQISSSHSQQQFSVNVSLK